MALFARERNRRISVGDFDFFGVHFVNCGELIAFADPFYGESSGRNDRRIEDWSHAWRGHFHHHEFVHARDHSEAAGGLRAEEEKLGGAAVFNFERQCKTSERDFLSVHRKDVFGNLFLEGGPVVGAVGWGRDEEAREFDEAGGLVAEFLVFARGDGGEANGVGVARQELARDVCDGDAAGQTHDVLCADFGCWRTNWFAARNLSRRAILSSEDRGREKNQSEKPQRKHP